MLNVIIYLIGSLSIGFIVETFFLSLLYGLANHFVLLPYLLFGFSGSGIPAPDFAQIEMMLVVIIIPYLITTLLMAYLTRSYQLTWFAVSIVIANFCMYIFQNLLFLDRYMIIDQMASTIFFFLQLVPFVLLIALFIRWLSLTKKNNPVKLDNPRSI